MADLAIPKKHPMQEHLDNIKDSHSAMESYFRQHMDTEKPISSDRQTDGKKYSDPGPPGPTDLGLGK